MVEHILFSHQTVMADRQSMVGGKKDISIVGFSAFFQGIQNASDLSVHVGDYRVVFLTVHFDGVFAPGEGSEPFISLFGAKAD